MHVRGGDIPLVASDKHANAREKKTRCLRASVMLPVVAADGHTGPSATRSTLTCMESQSEMDATQQKERDGFAGSRSIPSPRMCSCVYIPAGACAATDVL